MLIGGLRMLNANFGGTKFGVFTDRPETLTNDFFMNLLDMKYVWKPTSEAQVTFEGRERKSTKPKWQATRADPEGFGALTIAGAARNIVAVTLGNVVGGSVLVAGVYWVLYRRQR